MFRAFKSLVLVLLAVPALAAQQHLNTTTGAADTLQAGANKIEANLTDLYTHLYAPIGGDFSIPSGTNTGTINAGAIGLTKFFQFPADTALCNPTAFAATPIYCTSTQLAALIGYSGSSGIPNTINLCVTAGVDPTGVSDSLPAVTTAFALAASSGQTLRIDCPVFLHFGSDGTKPIFVGSGVDVAIGATGSFIIDNAGVNAFVFMNSTDGLWTCANQTACIMYKANFGSISIGGPSYGPYSVGVSQEYAAQLSYLVAHNGNTFASGTGPYWNGQGPFLGIFNIRGASKRLTFRNMTIMAPVGASPAAFIPTVVAVWPEWQSGVAVTSGLTSASANIASDIEWDHPTFDGFDMGFNGVGSLRIFNPVFKRYSDLQDGTSGTVVFAAALSAGASSATLAAPWALTTGQYCLTLSTAQVIGMTLTNGSTAATAFFNCSTGATGVTVTSTATAITTSGNVGGFGTWFAPPHAAYVQNQGVANFVGVMVIKDGIDYGPYVGLPTRRSTGSGSLISLKLELGGGYVDGYTSYRPDGMIDLMSGLAGTPGGVLRNMYMVYDSSVATSNGGTIWGFRFAQPTYGYNNFSMENIDLYDSAAVPQNMPLGSSVGNGLSSGINITNLKQWVNDWPVGATWYPAVSFGGSHINFTGEIHLANCSNTLTFKGVVAEQGSNSFTQSNVDVSVFGWRQLPVTFSAALASGATSATLAATWPYQTGTYKVFFSDNDIRYISLTNGSTTVGAFTALSAASTATATAGNALVNNYTGYIARATFAANGASYGNRVHIADIDNAWESTSLGMVTREDWTQEYSGSPVATTPIVFPSTFAIDRTGWLVSTAIGGITGPMGVGFSGGSTLLSAYITTSNVNFAPQAMVTSPGTAVTLTPASGTVTTGAVDLAVHAYTIHGAY